MKDSMIYVLVMFLNFTAMTYLYYQKYGSLDNSDETSNPGNLDEDV